MTESVNPCRLLCVLALLVGAGACAGKAAPDDAGASSTGGSTSTINPTSCTVDSDCTWTEIGVEILKPADCMCLYGCPYIVANKTTAERRAHQYDTTCNRGVNGKGQPCGIDDCAMPPAVFCLDGNCAARE